MHVFSVLELAERVSMSRAALIKNLRTLFDLKYLDCLALGNTIIGNDCPEWWPYFDQEEDPNIGMYRINYQGYFESGNFLKIPNEILLLKTDQARLLVWLLSKAQYSKRIKWVPYRRKRYRVERACCVGTFQDVGNVLGLERRQIQRLADQLIELEYLDQIPKRGECLWRINECVI